MKFIILIIVILFLFLSNLFLFFNLCDLQNEVKALQSRLRVCQTNEKVLNFTRLFIEKVLKGEKEIDFETRFQLENAVRNINDEEILNQWRKLVESKYEEEAQREVVNLLYLLITKIQPL